MHTSAKARLTSDAIRIRIQIRDPDCHQNLIICSLAHCKLSLKISSKSVEKFFFLKVANRQTDRQTNNDDYISSLAEVKISFLVCTGTQCTIAHLFIMSRRELVFVCDRYAVIVHPMKSRSWCSIGRTKKVICGIWIASLLLSSPLLHVMVSCPFISLYAWS